MTTNSKPATVAADRLKSFIERIEKLEEERVAIGGDIRDIYSEAKGVGYDVATMRKVVRLRKMDAADRDEQEALLDTYLHALGMVDRIEARVAAGESARQIAAAENVSKSTAHRVSQKARGKTADAKMGQRGVGAGTLEARQEGDGWALVLNPSSGEAPCAAEGSLPQQLPQPSVCSTEPKAMKCEEEFPSLEIDRASINKWRAAHGLDLAQNEGQPTVSPGAVAEPSAAQRVAAEIDLTPPPALVEKRREIDARRAAT